MNIVLIGYRGTGKSAVAAYLAAQTNRAAVSLDAKIVEDAQMTIPEIVKHHGWPYFRDLEQKITERHAHEDRLVLDTGGGVILRPENVAALKSNGTLIWLKAAPGVIEARISNSTDRPALVEGKTFLEEIEEVLSERTPLYDAAADFSVDTDNKTPEEIADEILRLLNA